MNGAHEGAREVSYEDLLVRTMTTKVKVDFPDGDIVKVED
jgi:hypothetical protein